MGSKSPLPIAKQIPGALEAAQGIVHRDLKPASRSLRRAR
jgi:hypothetical protein